MRLGSGFSKEFRLPLTQTLGFWERDCGLSSHIRAWFECYSVICMAETTRDGIQLYVHENLFSGYKHISSCAEFPILGTTLSGAQVLGQLSLQTMMQG